MNKGKLLRLKKVGALKSDKAACWPAVVAAVSTLKNSGYFTEKEVADILTPLAGIV